MATHSITDSASTDIGSNLNFEFCQDSIKNKKLPNNLKLIEDIPNNITDRCEPCVLEIQICVNTRTHKRYKIF
jgi:hypothetical protein